MIDVGHELRPRAGSFPSASEVARLLAAEFAYVKIDAADGLQRARERAEWIEGAPARLFLGHHERALEAAAKLRDLSIGHALTIEFGGPNTKRARIVVLPGEPVSFGYGTKEDESLSMDLVERCARALNCDVVLI